MCFFYFGFFGGVIFYILFYNIDKFFANTGKSFFKVQALLPTSKISSLAMGLVEVEGFVEADNFFTSKIKREKCIGYHYKIQEIKHDNDDKEYYTTIYTESLFNPFYLKDDTGKVKILPENLECLKFSPDILNTGSMRYVEIVLKPDNNKHLLIGSAQVVEGETVIAFDDFNKILSISPSKQVDNYNKTQAILQLIKPYFYLFLFWVVFILYSDIGFDNGQIFFKTNLSITETIQQIKYLFK